MTANGRASDVTSLTVGHVTHDRYGGTLRAGGSAFYGARTLHALGARSRLVTVVGEDFSVRDELRDLEVHACTAGRTTTFENEYPRGEPRRQWIEAVAPAVTEDLAPEAWRRADVLFLAPVCAELDVDAWLRAVDARVVAVGLQGLLKQPEPGSEFAKRRVVGRDLRLSDSFGGVHAAFLSDEDLALLAPRGFLGALRERVPIVVVTRGESGASIFEPGRETRVGVYRTHAKDPTGAGDTFAAAFALALARGSDAADAGRLAAAAASIVVEAEGGEALARLGESIARARDVPVESSR